MRRGRDPRYLLDGRGSRIGTMSDFIQFKPVQLSEAIPENTTRMSAACTELAERDLLSSYEGTTLIGSNGNISHRHEAGFIITGTQLGSKQNLESKDFVYIEKCTNGEAYFHGTKLPSSECLMHWYLYDNSPETHAIIHVHESNQLMYSEFGRGRWKELAIAETANDAGNGTIKVGGAAAEIFNKAALYVILKNHRPQWDSGRTGAVIQGGSLEEALKHTLNIHQALQP